MEQIVYNSKEERRKRKKQTFYTISLILRVKQTDYCVSKVTKPFKFFLKEAKIWIKFRYEY